MVQVLTDLSGDDRRPHHQQHQLVEQQVEKAHHWFQLRGAQSGYAALQLRFQAVLHDPHISDTHREHVLIQSMHQRKEFIQILVLREQKIQ